MYIRNSSSSDKALQVNLLSEFVRRDCTGERDYRQPPIYILIRQLTVPSR